MAMTLPAHSAPRPVVYAALGDSITSGQFATRTIGTLHLKHFTTATLTGTSYADLVARHLSTTDGIDYQNLGLGGAFAFTVWDIEIPRIARNATIVTLFVGVNDEIIIAGKGIFTSGPFSVKATIGYWQTAIQKIIQGIREASPSARIIVANVPNLARYPAYQPKPPTGADSDLQHSLSDASYQMNQTINALAGKGITVVDLRCDPNVYRAQAFANEVHPNDLGYAYLAERFIAAINRPTTPRSSCPPFTT
jgi:lysophospholipase L1-like esterase